MYTNFGGWELDITTLTMGLINRLSAIAFCYADGALDTKNLTEE